MGAAFTGAGTAGLPTTGTGLIRQAAIEARWGLVCGMIAAVLWMAARTSVPRLVQAAIDHAIDGTDSAWPWAAAIFGAGLISGIALGTRRYLAFYNARAIEARYRGRLFAHLQRLHIGYHDVTATGELLSRSNTDLTQFQQIFTMMPVTMGNALIVVAVTAAMVWMQPVLAVVALVPLPALWVLARGFSKHLHPAVRAQQIESAQLAAVVEQSVAGIRVVKGFGAESIRAQRLAEEADDVYDASIHAAQVRARYLPGIELLPNLSLILVLAYGGHLVIQDSLTVGQLVGFNLYVVMLIQPLRSLAQIVAQWQRAVVSGQRIAEVLSTPPLIVDPPHAMALPPRHGGGTVVFDEVHFTYPTGEQPVLRGCSLRIAAGETVAIVGATGAGKSTIARLLLRFYDIDSGQITLDGVDIGQLRRQDLRRAISLVFEDTFLFSGTIADNIAFADSSADAEQIKRAAYLAGAADFITDLPDGYDTVLGSGGLTLSGGQRQRLAIARAIVANPRVLILDDATSAVDPAKEHEIRHAMAEVMQGRTTIVIAHRVATIALADRVVLLDDGRIVAEGTHQELLEGNARYRAVLAATITNEAER